MINTSDDYKAAITGDARRVRLLVPLRISTPGMSIGTITPSGNAPMSKPNQLKDQNAQPNDPYITLEENRWTLDGSMSTLSNTYGWSGQVGWVSDVLSGSDGSFSTAPTVDIAVSGISTLQSVTFAFPVDSWPTSFTVSIKQSGTTYHSATITDCTGGVYYLTGFTVYNPDEISISFDTWSQPYCRARLIEVYPGYAADWTEDDLVSASVKMQTSFSGVTAPYGTASLVIDNTSHVFDPRNKEGVFESLEERMAVDVYLGVDTENGSTEYVPIGVYYKHNKAWTTQDSGMTMRWDFVDIIGLLSDAEFVVPGTLPTTLLGWIQAICASLGTAFASRYIVDDGYKSAAATVSSASAVSGKKCIEILRYVCQYTGTFFRADQETGYLAVEPYWSTGNEYTLDNLNSDPVLKMNNDLATITFRTSGGNIVISGNESSSSNNVSLANPFVNSQAEALQAAQTVFETYGGNVISITGRGDPSSEIGDVATVQLSASDAAVGRIMSQTFDFTSGVLKACKTELLQATGGAMYQNREIITTSGTWTAPAGVTSIFLSLIGGGSGGGGGTEGTNYEFPVNYGQNYGKPGTKGKDAPGARVWYSQLVINDGQTFNVTIGRGGFSDGGEEPVAGEATTFGLYSSANGSVYTPAYTDIYSGNAYARSGVESPKANTGDGGAGGKAGGAGSSLWVYDGQGNLVLNDILWYGTPPGSGVDGASGCVIVYWEE